MSAYEGSQPEDWKTDPGERGEEIKKLQDPELKKLKLWHRKK